MTIFSGAGVALVTPMKNDGSINYDVFAEIIDIQIQNGTDAIVACGTTGESSTLLDIEHIKAMRFCVEYTAKRIPVIIGTGSNNTAKAIDLSRKAEEIGADGCLLVTPYYNKTTQAGLYCHFSAIANSINIPCILYNVPSRTGLNILPETIAKLYKNVSNIIGIKEASGNISQVAQIASLTDGNMDIYSGNDDQIVPVCSLGGKGVISVLSNVAPKQTHDIVQACLDGDYNLAKILQLKAMKLINMLFCEVNPIPVKAAMAMQGYNVGSPRLPLMDIEDDHKILLYKVMKEYGCL